MKSKEGTRLASSCDYLWSVGDEAGNTGITTDGLIENAEPGVLRKPICNHPSIERDKVELVQIDLQTLVKHCTAESDECPLNKIVSKERFKTLYRILEGQPWTAEEEQIITEDNMVVAGIRGSGVVRWSKEQSQYYVTFTPDIISRDTKPVIFVVTSPKGEVSSLSYNADSHRALYNKLNKQSIIEYGFGYNEMVDAILAEFTQS